MTFNIVYNQDYKRIIPAVIIDGRGMNPIIATLGGFQLKAYTDSKVNDVVAGTISYKIETDMGNLAGYFLLKMGVSNSVLLGDYLLRPAFIQFDGQISQIINNFITSGDWRFDILI